MKNLRRVILLSPILIVLASCGAGGTAASPQASAGGVPITAETAAGSRGGSGSGFQTDQQELAAAAASVDGVLVVVGTVGPQGQRVTVTAPGLAPATDTYTPVLLQVEDVLRNTEGRALPLNQLTLRSWPGLTYNGRSLDQIPSGQRVVAFIQTGATMIDDGADTANFVFEIDPFGNVLDPATVSSLPLSELRELLADRPAVS